MCTIWYMSIFRAETATNFTLNTVEKIVKDDLAYSRFIRHDTPRDKVKELISLASFERKALL